MAKPTPGPWTYSTFVAHYERPELGGWAASVYEDDGVHEDNICKMEHEFDKETVEANARLIAASPELLEACEAAMRIETLWCDSSFNPSNCMGNEEGYALHLMREKLRAAIAKATGADS